MDTNFRDGNRWRFGTGDAAQTVEVSGPFRINSPIAVLDLAIADQGIALVPDFVAAKALASGALQLVLAGLPSFSWSIYAIYPRKKYLPGRVRAFVDFLSDEMSN